MLGARRAPSFRGNRQRLNRYDETDFEDMPRTLKGSSAPASASPACPPAERTPVPSMNHSHRWVVLGAARALLTGSSIESRTRRQSSLLRSMRSTTRRAKSATSGCGSWSRIATNFSP